MAENSAAALLLSSFMALIGLEALLLDAGHVEGAHGFFARLIQPLNQPATRSQSPVDFG